MSNTLDEWKYFSKIINYLQTKNFHSNNDTNHKYQITDLSVNYGISNPIVLTLNKSLSYLILSCWRYNSLLLRQLDDTHLLWRIKHFMNQHYKITLKPVLRRVHLLPISWVIFPWQFQFQGNFFSFSYLSSNALIETKFVHSMIAMLLWHIWNFGAIYRPDAEFKYNEIPIDFELCAKNC